MRDRPANQPTDSSGHREVSIPICFEIQFFTFCKNYRLFKFRKLVYGKVANVSLSFPLVFSFGISLLFGFFFNSLFPHM